MTDPTAAIAAAVTKAVASAASKKLTAPGPARLGGRDERRQVYARFQAELVHMTSFAQLLRAEQQISGPLMGRGRSRELMGMVHERQTELLIAYHELRLVGNPAPIAAGEAAMTAGGMLMDTAPSEHELQTFLERAMDAQRAFTDACRADLWYLPQWWQVYRGAWWKGRGGLFKSLGRRLKGLLPGRGRDTGEAPPSELESEAPAPAAQQPAARIDTSNGTVRH